MRPPTHHGYHIDRFTFFSWPTDRQTERLDWLRAHGADPDQTTGFTIYTEDDPRVEAQLIPKNPNRPDDYLLVTCRPTPGDEWPPFSP